MKLLHRLITYLSSRWSLLPDCQLRCAEQQLDDIRHQAERFSRGRWM